MPWWFWLVLMVVFLPIMIASKIREENAKGKKPAPKKSPPKEPAYTMEVTTRRPTVPRVLTLGLLGFAWRKKEKQRIEIYKGDD